MQLHGNLTKTGNSPWLKIFPLFANEHSKINCGVAHLIIDLEIPGPENRSCGYNIHFDLAPAQGDAGEEHPCRHPEQLSPSESKELLGAQQSQGHPVAVGVGRI